MIRRTAMPAWGLAAVLAVQPAVAAEATLGASRFDLPAAFDGWTRKDLSDGILLQRVFEPARPGGRKGAAMVLIGAPKPASSSFADGFARFAQVPKQVPAKDKPLTAREGETLDGHRIRVEQRCCRSTDGMSMNVWHVGVAAPGSEQYLMLFLLQVERETEAPVRDAFQALVRSLRPAPADRGFALAPASGDGGLDGLYARTETRLMPNAFGGLDFIAEQATLLFDKGGLYTTEPPRDGDLAGHCRARPATCGTYALKGGWFSPNRIARVAVQDGFGIVTRSSEPFARTGEGLTLGDQSYARVAPFAEGHRFAGTWTHSFASSGAMGSVGGARTLTLSPDGRFTREGSTGFSSTAGSGDGSTTVAGHTARPAQSGRYAVAGYRMTLKADDGGTETLSLFAPDKDSETLLVIGGSNYLKQGRR